MINTAKLPLNIDLLILDPNQLRMVPEVSALDIFKGSNRTFHPNGLFSVESFGKVGEERRNRTFGYINLKLSVFHPVVFKALEDLKGLYAEIMASKAYAVWDPKLKDFIKSSPAEGDTGYFFFLSHFQELEFEERKSISREFNIRFVKKYRERCLMDKLLVYPAGLRDFEYDESGRQREDEVNTLYRKVLNLANLVQMGVYRVHPETLDDTRYAMQKAVNDVYMYFRQMAEGKKKLILGKWATRQIFNGTINVITSLNTNTDELNSPRTVGFNQTAVGLYQYMKATLPVTLYHLKTGILSKIFLGPNSPAVLVDKKTLKQTLVSVKPDVYDNWMTDEGLEKTISRFGEEALRHLELTEKEYYFGLLYKGPGVYRFFQDIDELPEGYDRALVSPITFYELMYLSVYREANKTPCFVTRYPITGYGSVYPGYVYLKSTVKSDVRQELGEDWQPTGSIAQEFPIYMETSMNALSPHFSHLTRLGADLRFGPYHM